MQAGSLAAALALVIGTGSTPAMASTQADIDELTALIKKSGTEIVYTDCKDKSSAGKYTFSKKQKINRLMICQNSFDAKDSDAHWEVLAHEATHIMQRCNGGTLLEDEYHPRIWRRLKAQAPHYLEILKDRYRDVDQMHEAEAFVMEMQTPELVKEWFTDFCLTPKKAAAPTAADPSPPTQTDPKPESPCTCSPATAGTTSPRESPSQDGGSKPSGGSQSP